LCNTPEFTQVTTATKNWWTKADYMLANWAMYLRSLTDSSRYNLCYQGYN